MCVMAFVSAIPDADFFQTLKIKIFDDIRPPLLDAGKFPLFIINESTPAKM